MKPAKNKKTAWLLIAVLFVFMTITATPALCAQPEKVAIVPFFINSPQDLGFLQNGLFNMLFSRLSDPGKVDVLDRETVDKVMAQAQKADEIKGTLNESSARIIGANMGVDYILFGSLTHFGESVSLDASMVDITGEKATLTFFKQSNSMGDVIPMVNTFAGDINLKVFNRSIANELYAKPPSQGVQAPGGLQSADGRTGGTSGGFINLQQTGGKGFSTLLKFEGVITAMALGDLNKDGIIQVVAATDSNLLIHTLKDNHLVLEKKLEFNSSNRIVSLDIADINKNGYPEIFVTSLSIQREILHSFVVEYNGTDYVTLVDKQNYYYRVMDEKDGSKVLMGQSKSRSPFEGKIYTMTARGNDYVTGEKFRTPHGVSVLSLAKGAVTSETAEEYVLLNESGRLTVINDAGTIEWESNEKFGGTEHSFLLPQKDPDSSFRERVYLHPRLLFYDMGSDGKLEVLAVRNEELGGGALGSYKRFTKGNLEILSWNGISLAPIFKTQSAPGWISDFAIADINGDGKDELIISVTGKVKSALWTGQRSSNIISYELE